MDIQSIQLQQNQFMDDYQNEKEQLLAHFDYNPYQLSDYKKRLDDIQKRSYDRANLADVLHNMNQRWNAGEHTYRNIQKLKDENSVVVVGGQQAGLLTGPSYTMHKIISIIQCAKQQEEYLNVPVVPAFWIAGEDHDFAEINHIFMPQTSTMEKHTLTQRVADKWAVSDVPIEDGHAKEWLKSVFGSLKETSYTKSLYNTVLYHLEQSSTYVDFFARLIYALFEEEGIVLIDSHDPALRHFEKESFIHMINARDAISEGVWREQEKVKEKGYALTLEVEKDDGHLFYHDNHERILLEKTSANEWSGKNKEVSLTTDELREIARNQPGLLSNNVVTRPVMQELVLPTLAFVGGPGEVNYWSILGPAFHALDAEMPPVLPRLSFTYVDAYVQKLLQKYNVSIQEAIENGTEMAKATWLENKHHPSVQDVSERVKKSIEQAHAPLREIAHEMQNDIRDLSLRNLEYLKNDVTFLENRIVNAIKEKYQHEIDEFEQLHIHLHPYGGLQERIWNPLIWVNKYGTEFIKEMARSNLSFTQGHCLVYF